MERKDIFEIGEYYHVYNRGVNKYKIFFSKGDWGHFQKLLYLRNKVSDRKLNLNRIKKADTYKVFQDSPGTLVDIVAYAFMDNHFHLLLKEKQEGGISKFMSRLMTSYSMYMNKKYDRSGPLMCHPFRSRHIDGDAYLRWVISYIHLNPVDQIESKWKDNGISNLKKTLNFLTSYKYSSYRDYFSDVQKEPLDIKYVNTRQEGAIINKNALPIDISDLDNLKNMLEEYSKQEYLSE